MEQILEIVVEYSAFVAPALTLWATLLLHIQPRHVNHGFIQSLYFLVLLLVAVLTVRVTTSHDAHWLVHAGSLGTLIVAGALKQPANNLDSALGSES